MKQIVFFIFLCLTTQLTAGEKGHNLTDLLQSFGDNGEYSIYRLITRESRYSQDKLYALNIDLDYARFLNQKGDCEKACTLLTQIRRKATTLEKLQENRPLHPMLQTIEALATYETAYGNYSTDIKTFISVWPKQGKSIPTKRCSRPLSGKSNMTT